MLAVFGLACMSIWWRRERARTALALGALGLRAFALAHALGLLIGAWPAVLVAAAGMAAASWRLSDARARPPRAAEPAGIPQGPDL